MSVPAFVGNIAWIILGLVVRGWALSTMWAWFVVKQFGQRPLSYPEALGISGLIAMLVINPTAQIEKRDYWQNILISIMMNVLFVGVGWIWSVLL